MGSALFMAGGVGSGERARNLGEASEANGGKLATLRRKGSVRGDGVVRGDDVEQSSAGLGREVDGGKGEEGCWKED